MALHNRAVCPASLVTLAILFCLEARCALASVSTSVADSVTVLPRLSLKFAGKDHPNARIMPRTTPAPSAETSACHSLAESLATYAPTIPLEILSFEATYLMTASGCQTITPPASLSSQWSSWTSAVSTWMEVHSSEYTSYLSRCEAWELAPSLQCPTGTASMEISATATEERATKTEGAGVDSPDTATNSAIVTTFPAVAGSNSASGSTTLASASMPSATLVSSGVEGRSCMTGTVLTTAVLLLCWVV